ncbi:hypothetical protein HNQ44_002165 [Planomicrobium koreense]|uniref:Fimbrial assembly protein n=1 Tax=Planococcus koreensis TaxID=112331 RepID=A0A7W8CSW9_9BACL|nr:fimbrial assembly protein [Planococcus koreensis]MBB5180736.1 hypothetical protein [Planococcus koreensis]
MLVDINLLPQKERDRPASIVAAIAILLVAVIIWAVFAFLAGGHKEQQAIAAAQTVQVQAEQAMLREQLEAVQGMNEEQQLKATVDWAESYQFDTLPLLAELVSKLPVRGFFDSFSYTGMDVATLGVQFDTAREAAYYLAQLKTSSLLESATLDSVVQEELEEETAEDGTVIIDEDAPVINPRYLATYTLIFVDGRVPALTPEGEIIVEEPVTEEVPAETPPAEEAPAAEVDVNVEVDQPAPAPTTESETPVAPATEAPVPTDGTAGDDQ